jgi:SnoaL-like polyketide cyclase
MNRVFFKSLVAAALVSTMGFASAQTADNPTTPAPQHERQAPSVERNLRTFDIVVTWPDGHETYGIHRHIDDLKAMFVFAPDIQIKTHPIRFGSGTFTGVTGVMIGTFTKPMPVGEGKFIQPTGKRFALNMATIGHWTDKTMDHEWLYWDNQDFMKQLGVGQ